MIISFEPMKKAYNAMCNHRLGKNDPLWQKKILPLVTKVVQKKLI